MGSVRFTVPGQPKGKARARTVRRGGGKSFSYTPEGTVLYENLIKACYLQDAGHVLFNDGQPLAVDIIAFYEVPKSYSKKKKQEMLDGQLYPTKKPDIDNIAKFILDALVAKQVFPNDSQKYIKGFHDFFHVDKKHPRIEVMIEEGD